MKAQVASLLLLLLGVISAEDHQLVASQDLAVSESAVHYGYYPAPIPVAYGGHDSDYGHDSHGHLSKGYGSHGYGQHGDSGHYGKQGYDTHGGHLKSGYGDHGSYLKKGGHVDSYGKHGAYVRNSGHGYEKSYSYDKQVHLHDIDAHKSAHHEQGGDHGAHGYKDASHYGHGGHKSYGGHDKYDKYGYGHGGHLKSDYGKLGYGKEHYGKEHYGKLGYGGSYQPVYGHGYTQSSPGYYSYHY